MKRSSNKPRVIAVDLGKKRIGVAISDELGLMAHVRPTLEGGNRNAVIKALCELARDEGATRFLVGNPIEMKGNEGNGSRKALEFAQALANASSLDVELVDERLTSAQAERTLRDMGKKPGRDGTVDGIAAAILLQAWLDAR